MARIKNVSGEDLTTGAWGGGRFVIAGATFPIPDEVAADLDFSGGLFEVVAPDKSTNTDKKGDA